MMRIALWSATFASAACVLLTAANAHAQQSHYLLARSFNQFTGTASVSAPDLTTFVEGNHAVGVAGVNAEWMQNHAEVNSDTGNLKIMTSAGQAPGGPGTIQPKDWMLAARLEQNVIKQPDKPGQLATKGLRATFQILGAVGKVSHVKPISVKLNLGLSVDGCIAGASRTITDTTTSDFEFTESCNMQGATAHAEGSLLRVDMVDFGKVAAISVQVDATFSYADSFAGTVDSVIAHGNLTVEGIGGPLTFTSPTFGSKAPGAPSVDGGVPPPTPPPPGAGGSDAGGISTPAAPTGGEGSSDDGCSIGSSPHTSTGAFFGGALVLSALVRRVRRRRR